MHKDMVQIKEWEYAQEMNVSFSKALYQLDKGEFEEAEKNICKAIEECTNKYELIQIKCCYAEMLCELERYEEALEYVIYILDNTDEYDEGIERETALEIKDWIEEGQK